MCGVLTLVKAPGTMPNLACGLERPYRSRERCRWVLSWAATFADAEGDGEIPGDLNTFTAVAAAHGSNIGARTDVTVSTRERIDCPPRAMMQNRWFDGITNI